MPLLNGGHPAHIAMAADALAKGQLLAFATETVYGLGADAENDAAVAAIFQLKGRPSQHPLIVHIHSEEQVSHFARDVPDYAQLLMRAFWPGPLTLILPRKAGVATAAAGGQATIGLRCPAHATAQNLLHAAIFRGVQGVAAPSANRFGRVSPTTSKHVQEEFGDALLVLDGGACPIGIESTIVDCSRAAPVLLRPGDITLEQLEKVTATPFQTKDADAPRVSGSLDSHYAPRAKVRLVADFAAASGRAQIACYLLPSDAKQAAHDLFAQLRALDQEGIAEIWVSLPPTGQAWDGVRDRLQRAAY